MAIYVITHKKFQQISNDFYKTLLVGANNGHIFGDYYDDQEENISSKNPNYCELTGVYWVWKNVKDDIVGIVHYRRYFGASLSRKKILTERQALKKLNKYDIILPNKVKMPESIKDQLLYTFDEDTLEKLRNIIEKKCPQYLNTYDKVMRENEIYFCNMMICKKEIYDKYCEWLFDILFDYEKTVDLSSFDDYQKRIFGFMSERLLTIWVKYNNLSICELGVINTEKKDSKIKEILRAIRRLLSYIRN